MLRLTITSSCGQAGFVGEITDGTKAVGFRSCTTDGVARAAFLNSDGSTLIEYISILSGPGANKFRIGSMEHEPDGEMSPEFQARLFEVVTLPSAALMAAVPDELLELGFCEERPALAAMSGLAFLFMEAP